VSGADPTHVGRAVRGALAHRRRLPALLALALTSAVLCRASDARADTPPQPVVRVTIDAPQPVLIGQQVRMDVVVLVPNFFTGAPQFPPIEAPGAAVALLDDALNANDTIRGVGYAGVQRTYVVTPLQPGELQLPAARITFSYAAEPGKPGVASSAEIPAQTIRAQAAGDGTSRAGADTGTGATADGDTMLPVAQVTIEQSLDRGLDGLTVGDAVTRTVTTLARNAAAMSIPVPTFTAPDGVRVYTHDPVLTDIGERDGGPAGRRVDRVTYALERAGSYTLPAIEVSWLDPRDQQRQTSRAAEIAVTVAVNAAAAPAIAPRSAAGEEDVGRASGTSRMPRWVPWLAAGIVVAIMAIWAWRRWAHVVRTRLTDRRTAQATSEAACFARLDEACRRNDPDDAYGALAVWAPQASWPSLAAACAARPELATEVAALERHLYASHDGAHARAAWTGRALCNAAAAARPPARFKARPSSRHAVPLPALNP
jgi:hypothetical protein